MADLAAEEEGSKQEELNERLRKEGWYLGQLTDDAATSILKSASRPNTFIVYTAPEDRGYTLSARFQVEGVEDDIIEHLHIGSTEEGKFQLSGQADICDDVLDVVNRYVSTSNPPLSPALGRSYETQISIPDEPPEYDSANRALKPDIVPLPDVTGVMVEPPTEATTGDLSPSNSLRRQGSEPSVYASWQGPPRHMTMSHWHRYTEHHRCHPKNCWHGCWHRSTRWNGYREMSNTAWYNPCGTGPLRFLLLLLFWVFCGFCYGFGKCCAFCCGVCIYVCFYDDDD